MSNPIPTELACRIRLVIFDVDGVLTDSGVYVGATSGGEALELKRFNIQDGVGLKMLGWGGLDVIIVSGRVSEAPSFCPDANVTPAAAHHRSWWNLGDLLPRRQYWWQRYSWGKRNCQYV